MILRLAAVLDLPLRQQNALLLAAGFAPAWRESDLSAPELAQVNSALDHMLGQQELYPAFVVDRRWNLLRANAGAARLVEFLTGPPPASAAASAEPVNLGTRQTADLLTRLLAFPDLPALSQIASPPRPGRPYSPFTSGARRRRFACSPPSRPWAPRTT
jgi:hypothetical protein